MEFARENERSELTGELIGDTLDDALADDGDAEAEDQIVSQVSRVKLVGFDLGVCVPCLLFFWHPPWERGPILCHGSALASHNTRSYSCTEIFRLACL